MTRIAIGVIVVSMVFGQVVQAATYTWTQNNWSAGANAIETTSHNPGANNDTTGWTKYGSAQNITAGTTVAPALINASIIQTDNTNSNTGFNLTGASNASTTVSSSAVGLATQTTTPSITTTDNSSNIAQPGQKGGWTYGTRVSTIQNGVSGDNASIQLAPATGSGAEGAFNCASGICPITAGVHNYTTFTIAAGATTTVTGVGGVMINATGTVTINGVFDVSGGNGSPGTAFASGGHTGGVGGSGGGTGGAGIYGGGAGNPGTNGTSTDANGGSGGTGVGTGGVGGSYGGGGGGGRSGAIGGSYSGGGGSGGNTGSATSDSGSGGGGGGYIKIVSNSQITVSGTLSANGGNGGVAYGAAGGGGGGGGGRIWLEAPTVTNNGTISAIGGLGGVGTYTGGNGGGGVVRVYTTSGTMSGNAPVVTGNAIGTTIITTPQTQYQASGTYTSYINAGGPGTAYTWDSFSWTQTSPVASATISYKLVGTNTAVAPSAGTFAASACSISATTVSGSFTPSGACATALNGYQYLWYQATLNASTDLAQTPLLDSVSASATVSMYSNAGVYTSGIIDTGATVLNWGNLDWTNSGSASTTVAMQIRTGNNPDLSDARAFSADAYSSWTVAGMSEARGIDNDAANNLYIISGSSVKKYNTSGGLLATFAIGVGTNRGLAIDAFGYGYANSGISIKKFDTTTGAVVATWGGVAGAGNGQFGSGGTPYLAVDSLGNVYATDIYNNRVQKFDTNGNYLTQWGGSGATDGKFNTPTGIAVDVNDFVYVQDAGNNRVQKFDTNGNYIAQFYALLHGGGIYGSGMNIDQNGFFYLADYSGTTAVNVKQYAPDGTYVRDVGSYAGTNAAFTYSRASAPAFDSLGNIYLPGADRIGKYTLGQLSKTTKPVSLALMGAGAGDRYIQYRATLSTTNTSQSPSLDSVTIGYTHYATSSYIISSAFDGEDVTNTIAKLQWAGTTPGSSTIKFQLATSSDNITWGNFVGPDGLTSSYFTAADGSHTLSAGFQNAKWLKYKAYFTSDGSVTPTLTSATTTYVVNAPPQFDATYGTNGITVAQSSTVGATLGKVIVSYKVRDVDGNTGSGTVAPSFEYSTNNGSSWAPITSAYLAAGNLDAFAVDTVAYTTKSVTWDAKAQLGELYTTTTKVRASVFDGQAANATSTAASATFTLDTKNPINNGLTFDAGVAGQTNSGSVTINRPTENNTAEYLLTDGTSTVGWTTISATTTIPWTFDSAINAKTLRLQVRDNYGNYSATTTHTTAVPADANGFLIQDVSKIGVGDYRLYIGWSTSTPVNFSAYKLEYATSTDNATFGTYSDATVITDPAITFFVHTGLRNDLYYRYRIGIRNTSNNISVRANAYINARPDGVQNFGEGGGGSVASAASVRNIIPTQTASAGTATISYTLTDASITSKTNPAYEGYVFYNLGITVVDSNATTITVSDATKLATSGFVQINNEVIRYTTKTGNVLSGLTRGTWPTAATARQTRQNTTIFAGTPVWIKATSTSPVTIANTSISTGQNGSIVWNTLAEQSLAGTTYSGLGVRVLVHDNQPSASGPLTSQSDLSDDGIFGIMDLATPTIQFTTTSATTPEDANATTSVVVALSKPYALPVSVTYAVDPASTGVLGTSYTMATTTGTLTIEAGATSTNIELAPMYAPGYGADKTVIINLASPVNATLGANGTFTYTIQEADFDPVIGFELASSTVSEEAGTTTIAIQLSYASNQELVLPLSIDPSSTAVAGVGYVTPTSTVVIPAGATSASVEVVLLHDTTYGPDKTLTVTLGSVAGMTLGATTTHTVVITEVDNAAPQIGSVTATQVASSTEADFGKVVITYTVRDTNTNSGTVNPSFVSPSFEYNTGLGWNAITNLRAEDVANKSVAEDVYAPYTAIWDAQAQLGAVSLANVQVRVTARDNEPLNGAGQGTSTAFAFDRQVPQVAQFKFDARTGVLTIAINDTNAFAYTVSNNEDLSADGINATSGVSTTVDSGTLATTMVWTVSTSTYPSIYMVATDALGNTVTNRITIPGKPQDFAYNDTSDVKNSFFKELISWLPYVSTSSAPFASYDIYRSVDGSAFELLVTKTNVNENYIVDAGLASSSSYTYRMTITDTYGSVSEYSDTITDTPDGQGQTDLVAPSVIGIPAVTARNTSAAVTWTTDEIATAVVEYSTTAANDFALIASSTSLVAEHSVTLTELEPNTEYAFRVRSTDPAGNTSPASDAIVFVTTGGPIVTEVAAVAADRAVTITWNTNKDADSTVTYSRSANFSGSSEVAGTVAPVGDASTTSVFAHTVTITGLDAGTTYYYKVASTDGAGNETIDDNDGVLYTFQTLNDIYPPVISDVSVPLTSPESIVIFWKTDELATSQIEYDQNSTSTFANQTTLDSTLSIYHSMVIADLSANTTYNYRVKSRDMFGNEAVSTSTTVTTAKEGEVRIVTIGGAAGQFTKPPEEKDTTAPEITNIEVATTTAFGATIVFMTNEPTVAFVQYGREATYGDTAGNKTYAQKHEIRLNGLRMGTEYHFQAQVNDRSGNTTLSEDQVFKTKFFSQASSELKTVENIQQYEDEVEQSIESILPGILPPFIEEPRVIETTENTATLRWRTNINAYAGVLYAEEVDFGVSTSTTGQYTEELSQATVKEREHTMTLVGLKPNTKYHFKVRSFSLPQVVGESADMTFTTKAPKVSASIIDIKNSSFRVIWSTEQPASTIVEYKNTRTGITERIIDEKVNTYHDILVERVLPGVLYEVRVFGYTASGALIESGAALSALTSRDVSAPKISNFKVDGALVPGRTDRVQTVITWTTDEMANSTVYYQEGAGAVSSDFANKAEQLDTFTTNHAIILSSLKPGTIYQMKIVSTDSAGNIASFGPRTIITPQKGESIFDVIFKNFEETFKFLRGAGQ